MPSAIRRYLEQEANFMRQHSERWESIAPQPFVLEHGIEFEWSSHPADVEYGRPKRCFANALLLAAARPDLAYVEGYAYHPLSIPTAHAWCVTEGGEVVDPTWRHMDDACGLCEDYDDPCPVCSGTGRFKMRDMTGASYLGVPFDTAWVIRTVIRRNGDTAVLSGLEMTTEVPRSEQLANIRRIGAAR